jgi:hypothetical protein
MTKGIPDHPAPNGVEDESPKSALRRLSPAGIGSDAVETVKITQTRYFANRVL